MEKAYKLEFAPEENEELVVASCGLSRTQARHHFGPAVKPHYMIHFVISGKGVFKSGGMVYPLSAGYGFLITPEILSYYEADEEDPWTYVWVGFGGSRAGEVVADLGLSTASPIFQSENSDRISELVRQMMDHNTFSYSDHLARSGLLRLFLGEVAGSAVSPGSAPENTNYYVIKALEYIKSNYYNPIRITDIASYVCVNRSYLYTLFMNELEISPQQYLSSFRISKACDMLKVTDLPIESIALSCGYSDPLVFSKAFRHEKGMPPSAYRRSHRTPGDKSSADARKIEDYIDQKKPRN